MIAMEFKLRSRGRKSSAKIAALALLLAAQGCRAAFPAPEDAPEGPYALLLGTAQDGGLPQIGCELACCATARTDPRLRRRVTSVLVADPRTGKRFLLDASPDLPEQVRLARGHPPTRHVSGPRPPLFEGIFPTHAHMGHYTGLLFLGPEAYGAGGVPVHASTRMREFLCENGPWDLLVETGTIELVPLESGRPVSLGPDLTLEALPVPHREEYTDTLAFVVRGPERSLLYLPDIDKWERWERPVEELVATVDVALLDGSFFDDGEIPGRDLASIPHPFIVESLARFASLPPAERGKILFTHLNHTNPAADPTSAAARRVRAAGMGIAREGQVIGL